MRASAPAYALGLVKGHQLVVPELLELAQQHLLNAFRLAEARARIEEGVKQRAMQVADSTYLFGLLAWAQDSHRKPRALVEHLVGHHLAGYRMTKGRT